MAATIAKHQVTCLYIVFKANPCKDLLDSICPTIEVDFNRNQLWTARGPRNTSPTTHTHTNSYTLISFTHTLLHTYTYSHKHTRLRVPTHLG